MTAYLIRYQIRRRGIISIPQGDWQDKEEIVVAGDDGRDAVNEIVGSLQGRDFLLKEIEIIGQVTKIAQEFCS